MEHLSLLAAFSIGLMGGAHCLAMCGSIMGALTLAAAPQQRQRRLWLIALYNVGRIISYVVIAAFFYLLLHSLEHYFSLYILRYIAGILLILMGFYLADWWRGLRYLEKLGGYLWQFLQPMSRYLLPVNHGWQALCLGALWGWLPCGLIYTALIYSATASSVYSAAAVMFSFALGTLPTVITAGVVADKLSQWIRRPGVRLGFALILLFLGVWTIVVSHVRSPDQHSVHQHYLRY